MVDEKAQSNFPALSLSEKLTRNFDRWEKRGRGWQFWEDVVELEPVYEPFYHFPLAYQAATDDGRKHTIISSLIERLKGSSKPAGFTEQEYLPEEPEPELFIERDDLDTITISLPVDQKISLDYAEELLLNLTGCALPLSFEIVGTSQASSIQLVCRQSDSVRLREQLNGYFPDAVVYGKGESFDGIWDKSTMVVDFGLYREFMRPLRTYRNLDPDPLTGILAAMENLQEGELGILQVLFQPAGRLE